MRVTQSLFRHYRKLPLTTKDVNKGYYKGNRTGRMGTHTKYGGYVIDWTMVRTYVVPNLKDFKLTPFVTQAMPRTWGQYNGDKQGPRNPQAYINRWKEVNGFD